MEDGVAQAAFVMTRSDVSPLMSVANEAGAQYWNDGKWSDGMFCIDVVVDAKKENFGEANRVKKRKRGWLGV